MFVDAFLWNASTYICCVSIHCHFIVNCLDNRYLQSTRNNTARPASESTFKVIFFQNLISSRIQIGDSVAKRPASQDWVSFKSDELRIYYWEPPVWCQASLLLTQLTKVPSFFISTSRVSWQAWQIQRQLLYVHLVSWLAMILKSEIYEVISISSFPQKRLLSIVLACYYRYRWKL